MDLVVGEYAQRYCPLSSLASYFGRIRIIMHFASFPIQQHAVSRQPKTTFCSFLWCSLLAAKPLKEPDPVARSIRRISSCDRQSNDFFRLLRLRLRCSQRTHTYKHKTQRDVLTNSIFHSWRWCWREKITYGTITVAMTAHAASAFLTLMAIRQSVGLKANSEILPLIQWVCRKVRPLVLTNSHTLYIPLGLCGECILNCITQI